MGVELARPLSYLELAKYNFAMAAAPRRTSWWLYLAQACAPHWRCSKLWLFGETYFFRSILLKTQIFRCKSSACYFKGKIEREWTTGHTQHSQTIWIKLKKKNTKTTTAWKLIILWIIIKKVLNLPLGPHLMGFKILWSKFCFATVTFIGTLLSKFWS